MLSECDFQARESSDIIVKVLLSSLPWKIKVKRNDKKEYDYFEFHMESNWVMNSQKSHVPE